MNEVRVDWWLGRLNRYGYCADLVDGPHSTRGGAEKALVLHRRLFGAFQAPAIVALHHYEPEGAALSAEEERVAGELVPALERYGARS